MHQALTFDLPCLTVAITPGIYEAYSWEACSLQWLHGSYGSSAVHNDCSDKLGRRPWWPFIMMTCLMCQKSRRICQKLSWVAARVTRGKWNEGPSESEVRVFSAWRRAVRWRTFSMWLVVIALTTSDCQEWWRKQPVMFPLPLWYNTPMITSENLLTEALFLTLSSKFLPKNSQESAIKSWIRWWKCFIECMFTFASLICWSWHLGLGFLRLHQCHSEGDMDNGQWASNVWVQIIGCHQWLSLVRRWLQLRFIRGKRARFMRSSWRR